MKTIVNGKSIDTKVLVINNAKHEIMITESDDGSLIVTKNEDGNEVVIAYLS